MNRDETKRAADEVLRGDAWGATDRELWLDIERRKYARAFLAQCEREEKVKRYLYVHRTQLKVNVAELDAAIKAIEEGRG